MATYIPGSKTYGEIGENFGAGLVKGYQTRSDQKAIQRAIDSLPKNASHREIIDALTKTRTYSPEAKKEAVANYLQSHKIDQDTFDRDQRKRQLDIQEAAQQETVRHNQATEAATSTKEAPHIQRKKNENVKETIDYEKSLGTLKSTLDDVAEMERLAPEFAVGANNLFNAGKAYLGIGDATYFNDLGAKSLQPIIKVFNPAGTLAVSKLDWIKKNFQPLASDTQETIDAKLKATRRFAEQARQRALSFIQLMEESDYNPSAAQIADWSQASDDVMNVIANEANIPGVEVPDSFKPKQAQAQEGFPDPVANQNRIWNQDGVRYRAVGTQWVKI